MQRKRLLITGGYGFLGRFVVAEYERRFPDTYEVMTFRSSEFDLCDNAAVRALIAETRPAEVIHLAAVVGGIGANRNAPGDFFYKNMAMGLHLIEECRKAAIQKFLMVGTVCSYPKLTSVPFREDNLWDGYPEETNAPYGIAKKALMVQLEAYRKQYNFPGISLLMVNLFGPGDSFDLKTSHVIPAMIRKFHEAKATRRKEVTLWGDGSPTREFLYVEDAARAICLALQRYNDAQPVNIGSGREISMRELASFVQEVVGYRGTVVWDASKPNGQPRRCLDVSRARERFGFEAEVDLRTGLRKTYDWYLEQINRGQLVARKAS